MLLLYQSYYKNSLRNQRLAKSKIRVISIYLILNMWVETLFLLTASRYGALLVPDAPGSVNDLASNPELAVILAHFIAQQSKTLLKDILKLLPIEPRMGRLLSNVVLWKAIIVRSIATGPTQQFVKRSYFLLYSPIFWGSPTFLLYFREISYILLYFRLHMTICYLNRSK